MALHQPAFHLQHHYSRPRPVTPQTLNPPTPELTPPKMELAINKVGAPLGGPMAAPSSGLASYAAQMVVWLWFGTHTPTSPQLSPISRLASSPPVYPLNPLQVHPSQSFARFVQVVLETTLVSHSVTIVALLYIYRLKLKHRHISGTAGSEYRLFVSSLVLSNKFLDDNTYTNRTWADIAGIDLKEVNGMETEFLEGLNYDLNVDPSEYRSWLSMLDGFVAARDHEASAASSRPRTGHHGGPYHSPISPYQEARARSASPLPPGSERRPRTSPVPLRKRSAVDAFALDLPQPYQVLDNLHYPAKKVAGDWAYQPPVSTVPPPTSRPIARLPSTTNMYSRRGSNASAGWQGDVHMSGDSRPQTAVEGQDYRVLMAPYERPPSYSMVPPEQMFFYSLSARSHPGPDGAPRKAVLHYQDPSHPGQVPYQQQRQARSHRPSLSVEYRNPHQTQPYRSSNLSTSTSPSEISQVIGGGSPIDFQYAASAGNGRPLPALDTHMHHTPYRSVPMQSHPYMYGSPSPSTLPNPYDYTPSMSGHLQYNPVQPRPASFANAGLPGYVYGQPVHAQQLPQQMAYSAHPSAARTVGLGLDQAMPSGSRSEWSSPARVRQGWY